MCVCAHNSCAVRVRVEEESERLLNIPSLSAVLLLSDIAIYMSRLVDPGVASLIPRFFGASPQYKFNEQKSQR